MTSKANLDSIPAILAPVVTAGIENGSAFQKAAKQVELDGNGTILTQVEQADAVWVAEGQLKPVVDSEITQMEMRAAKLARTTLYTKELADDIPGLEAAVKSEMAATLARTFDRTVLGFVDAPAGFDTFKDLDGITVTDYASFIAAVRTVSGYTTSAIVLNASLLDDLRGAVTPTGVPALTITGDYVTGSINGVPYYVVTPFGNAAPVGIVGPFATRAMWGIIPNSVEIEVLTETAITADGVVHALKQENKIGLLVAVRYGFRVYNEAEFKKIVGANSGS